VFIDGITILAQASGGGEPVPSGSDNPLIDWFTVVAQIVNFLILVALLRYFLYDRILAAMDRREQKIAERWSGAERRARQANEEAESLRRQQRELDAKRESVLNDVKQDAARRRDDLIGQARREVDELRTRWIDSVKREQQTFLDELRKRTAEGACAIARQALITLADAELERQIVHAFLTKLASLDDHQRDQLRNTIQDSDHRTTIRSAFDLPDDLRERITATVRDTTQLLRRHVLWRTDQRRAIRAWLTVVQT